MKKQFFLIPVFSLIAAIPVVANAQIYSVQPNVATSLGNAAGAALSGNYNNPTATMYFGNNSAMYRNNQVYGGPDYVASFYGQNRSANAQSEEEEEENKRLEEQKKNEAQVNLDLANARKEVEDIKKREEMSQTNNKNKKKQDDQDKAKSTEKSSSPYIDNSVPLSVIGRAKALDGISMKVGNTLVILHGMTAPGNGQMCNGDGIQYDCGDKATQNLGELVNGKTVACTGWGNYGICVSQGDGTNVNNYILGQGIAKPE